MILKFTTGTFIGFIASALLYDITHCSGFPELARDAIGVLLVILVFAMLDPSDQEGQRRVFLSVAMIGLGVAFARVLRQLWSGA